MDADEVWRSLGVADGSLDEVDLAVASFRALGFSRQAISRIIGMYPGVVDQRLDKLADALVGVQADYRPLLARFGLDQPLEALGKAGILDEPEQRKKLGRTGEAWEAWRAFAILEFARRAAELSGTGSRVVDAHTTLDRLGWPGTLLQGDCRTEYRRGSHSHVPGRDDIRLIAKGDASDGYRGPSDRPEVQRGIWELCDVRWNAAEKAGAQIHNRPFDVTPAGGAGGSPPRRIRALSYVPGNVDVSRYGVVEAPVFDLWYERTWYWYAMGTNFALSDPSRGDLDLDRAERWDVRDLEGSILANPLSTNLAVIMESPSLTGPRRRWVLIQERGRKSASNTSTEYRYQTSGAGFVDVEDSADPRVPGDPDPWIAAARELEQEAGLTVDPDHIVFLGLARDLKKYEVGLFGYVRIEGTPERVRLRPPREAGGEVNALRWWPWTPAGVLAALIDVGGAGTVAGGVNRFLPLGAIAILASLIHDFRDRVDWELDSLQSAPGPVGS